MLRISAIYFSESLNLGSEVDGLYTRLYLLRKWTPVEMEDDTVCRQTCCSLFNRYILFNRLACKYMLRLLSFIPLGFQELIE